VSRRRTRRKKSRDDFPWIKTAQIGKVLTTLDDNVKQGKGVVAELPPLLDGGHAIEERYDAAK
jgi:hypothetical protein